MERERREEFELVCFVLWSGAVCAVCVSLRAGQGRAGLGYVRFAGCAA